MNLRNPSIPVPLAAGTHSKARLIVYGVTALLAVVAYGISLGSEHIATSVDELTYVHITRVTAASGHLLPLQSEIKQLRNLKPPLLFWQGIVSTDWGKNWSRWQLRYPSLIYTLLTGALVFLLGHRITGQVATGLLAFVVFLAFFSTYRYCRSFLTDPPLVFWLFLPFFVVLYWERAALASRFVLPPVLGVIIGVGVLYKSLALALPVLGALGWWFAQQRDYQVPAFLARDGWKLAVMAVIAAAIFALWFILDPDPKAIWQQFVLRENVEKFSQPGTGYLRTLFCSGESIWKMLAAYPINAGLLAFPMLALPYVAYQSRLNLPGSEKLLWKVMVTYLVLFSLPSHRSERYLLPAMPTLAVLLALNWDRFNRHVLGASAVAAGVAVAVLIYLSVCLQARIGPPAAYPTLYWLLLGVTALLILVSLLLTGVLRACLLTAVFLVYLCLAGFMRPLDGSAGSYDPDVVAAVRGRDLWVPSRFNAREEGYRFLFPGANIHAYDSDLKLSVADLAARYPLFIVRLPIGDGQQVSGKVLGQRLDLASLHNVKQVIEALRDRSYDRFFLKELLIEAAGPAFRQSAAASTRCRLRHPRVLATWHSFSSNQPLQPTATRRAFTFFMTKTVPEIFRVAPGSRG